MNQNKSSSSSKQFSNDQCQSILKALLEHYKDGKVEHGTIKTVAETFNVSRNCIGQVWKQANEFIENGCAFMDVWSHKTNYGRKTKEINMNQVLRMPLRKRGTIRSTAQALKIPKSTLFNHIQGGKIWRHSNMVKPYLTLANISLRPKYEKVLFRHARTQTTSYNKKQAVYHQGDIFGSNSTS